jgi:membrane glycosyltransferase
MLLQSRQMWEILIGRDSGWVTQRRGVGSAPWHEVLRRHWLHTLIGLLVVILLWWLSPPLLAWMSPTLLGLLLALPFSKASGSSRAGLALQRFNVLTIPEETLPPAVMSLRDRLEPRFQKAVAGAHLLALLSGEPQRVVHFHYVLPAPKPPRGQPDLERLAVSAKLAEAENLNEAIAWLKPGELLAALNDRALFEGLLRY